MLAPKPLGASAGIAKGNQILSIPVSLSLSIPGRVASLLRKATNAAMDACIKEVERHHRDKAEKDMAYLMKGWDLFLQDGSDPTTSVTSNAKSRRPGKGAKSCE